MDTAHARAAHDAAYREAEAALPRTADQARDEAQRNYLTASALVAMVTTLDLRRSKRQVLYHQAQLNLQAAHWLLLEERRLRAEDRPARPGPPVKTYHGYLVAAREWASALTTLVDDHQNPDDLREHSEVFRARLAVMRTAHDTALTALAAVELAAGPEAVRASRDVYATLHSSASTVLGGDRTTMNWRDRVALVASADFAGLLAAYRADLGNTALADADEPAYRYASSLDVRRTVTR